MADARASNKSEDFFLIQLSAIEGKTLFPFHIYVYNPKSGYYAPFLWGNDPLTKPKFKVLHFIYNIGGGIAIRIDQKKTFMGALDLRVRDVPSLEALETHSLKVQQKKQKNDLKKVNKLGEFKFQETFQKAVYEDDFMPLVERSRLEISAFSVTTSHSVSLARHLALELLWTDNFTNRIVSTAYQLAKLCNIGEEEALSDLICAAFFHHIGQTQMELSVLRTPSLRLIPAQLKKFRQHSGLSQHLLKKSGVDLTDRCRNIIIQHHERYDGSGFPEQTKGEHLDPLALVLGAVSHIFEYSMGRVTGDKTPMPTVIKAIKDNNLPPGLEIEFGQLVVDHLAYLIKTEIKATAEKKSEDAANKLYKDEESSSQIPEKAA